MNDGDEEFSVDAIVSKAAAKQWNTDHPKNKARVIDTDDFEGKYKCEAPFPEQDSQYIIKFKKINAKKGVNCCPEDLRPRVLVPVDGGKPLDVTFETFIANGSKGKVSWSTFEGPAKFPGTFVQLNAILVEEMIEYVSSGGTAVKPGEDFGATDLAAVPKNQKAVNKQDDPEDDTPAPAPKKPAAKAAGKPVKKTTVTDFSDMDDDIPF